MKDVKNKIKNSELLRWYYTMLVIRFFEQQVEKLFAKGLIRGTSHTAIGQEAVAVGVASAIKKRDYVTSTHRGHGHFIACGGDPRRIMAELYGKSTGYSRGHGGSQMMANFSIGFIGANGITGGSIPVATGIALSIKLQKQHSVVICFFGDGASNQGTFHESLNMAGLWKLPVVYVCENNQYAMSMHVSRAIPVKNIAMRANSYGFQGIVVDGNDVLAVHNVVADAIQNARNGAGPTLIECVTYRLSGHSRGDPRIYRSREEEELAWQNDPIKRFKTFLQNEGILTPVQNKKITAEARRIVREAVQFARKSDFPPPETLYEGVYIQ